MTDRYRRTDGYEIRPGNVPTTWWVFDPDGRRVKSYTADTLEDADRRLQNDIDKGRLHH